MEDKQHKIPRYVEWSWPGVASGAVVGGVTAAMLSSGSQLRNPPILGGTIAAIAEVVHQRSFDLSVYKDEMFMAILKGAFIFWAMDKVGLDDSLAVIVAESALVGGLKINVYDESK